MAKKMLGQILVEASVIDEYQLKSALGFQKKWGGRLGRVLVEHHFLTEEALVQAIQQQTSIPVVEVTNRNIPAYLLKLVPFEMAENHNVLPIGLEGEPGKSGECLLVAMSDPTNLAAVDELQFKTGKRVKAYLAGEIALARAIALHYQGLQTEDFESVDPRQAQFSGPEMEGADLVLVQGTLEQSPPGGAEPVLEVEVSLDDPFAELDALAAAAPAPAPALTDPQAPAPPPEPLVDPFAELETLRGRPVTPEASPERSPEEERTSPEVELLEEADLVEEIELVEEAAPPPPAGTVRDPSLFEAGMQLEQPPVFDAQEQPGGGGPAAFPESSPIFPDGSVSESVSALDLLDGPDELDDVLSEPPPAVPEPIAAAAAPQAVAGPPPRPVPSSDAMRALLSRVGLASKATASGTTAVPPTTAMGEALRPEPPVAECQPVAPVVSAPVDTAGQKRRMLGADPAVSAVIQLLIRKGIFTREELLEEIDGK